MRTLMLPIIFTVAILMVAPVHAKTCSIENPNTMDGILHLRWLPEESSLEPRDRIQWDITELALEKSGVPYSFEVSEHSQLPGRYAADLEKFGAEGNVILGGIDLEIKTTMRPVRIPLYQGLLSYWHVWTREDRHAQYAGIRTLKDLRELSILQGTNWATVKALRAQGFVVLEGSMKNSPKMIERGRIDGTIFPAINMNIYGEQFGARDNNVLPLTNTMVRYPFDHFLYVEECSTDLHDALHAGLTAAIADGSLEDLYRTNAKSKDAYAFLAKGNFSVVEIENPELADETLAALEKYQVRFSGQ